jgi:hypothetical protein
VFLLIIPIILQFTFLPWRFRLSDLFPVRTNRNYGFNRHSIGSLGRGISPVVSTLPTRRSTRTQKKRGQKFIPRVRFEPTIPVFKRAKTSHALRQRDRCDRRSLCSNIWKNLIDWYMEKNSSIKELSLHDDVFHGWQLVLVIKPPHGPHRTHRLQPLLRSCVCVLAAITWRLLTHCLATDTLQGPNRKQCFQKYLYSFLRIRCRKNVFTEPLPSSGRLPWLHYFGLQASCHNMLRKTSAALGIQRLNVGFSKTALLFRHILLFCTK